MEEVHNVVQDMDAAYALTERRRVEDCASMVERQ